GRVSFVCDAPPAQCRDHPDTVWLHDAACSVLQARIQGLLISAWCVLRFPADRFRVYDAPGIAWPDRGAVWTMSTGKPATRAGAGSPAKAGHVRRWRRVPPATVPDRNASPCPPWGSHREIARATAPPASGNPARGQALGLRP